VTHPRGHPRNDRRVTELSRTQLLVYGAVGLVVLLVGARWVGASQAAPASGPGGDGVAFADASTPHGEASGFSLEQDEDDVVVHVAGEVRDPGVYRLPAGSRVTDAVERAGGPSAVAAPDGVNLAARVADGQQVVIPRRAPGPAGVVQGSASVGAATPEGPISLGTATVEQLDTIEGIGPTTAETILEFRDQHGGLASVEELDQVPGIGPVTMEALRARLQP
jgi:competence protein ComEA